LGYYCQFSPYDCDDTKGGNPNGVCTAVGSGTSIKGGAYLKSPGGLDWWSAYSWCKGNGMNLVTGTITTADGTEIQLNSYSANTAGNGPLYQYFGEEFYFWTGHDYGDSCYAWEVFIFSFNESVYESDRNNNIGYALCQ
jgi:hypothetical protein